MDRHFSLTRLSHISASRARKADAARLNLDLVRPSIQARRASGPGFSCPVLMFMQRHVPVWMYSYLSGVLIPTRGVAPTARLLEFGKRTCKMFGDSLSVSFKSMIMRECAANVNCYGRKVYHEVGRL